MDVVLKPLSPAYGLGRFHPEEAFGRGCISVLLLGSVEIGGITEQLHHLLAKFGRVRPSPLSHL